MGVSSSWEVRAALLELYLGLKLSDMQNLLENCPERENKTLFFQMDSHEC